jgi:hypothetical protein
MNEAAQFRVAGCVVALLIGLGVPVFLAGPVLFEGIAWAALSNAQIGWSAALFCFGVWLFLVSVLAETEEVRKVVEPFQGAEAVVLFLPYMLWTGTRGIFLRLRKAWR